MDKVTIGCRECGTWYQQTANNHVNIGNGCPECALSMMVSKKETDWLDSLGILVEDRQKHVHVNGKTYNVDALVGRVVYEYYGSYFHGDPRVTEPQQLIGKERRPAHTCYTYTLSRQSAIESLGYEVKYVWEFDADQGLTFSQNHPSSNYARLVT